MFPALSSFRNEVGPVLKLLADWCRFGSRPCFGLVRGDDGRRRSNVWLFLLGGATAILRHLHLPVRLHMPNPLRDQATVYRPGDLGDREGSLTLEETSASKAERLFGFRNTGLIVEMDRHTGWNGVEVMETPVTRSSADIN
jgi:hypothetical protein